MQPIKTALASFGMSGMLFHAPFLHVDEGFELYRIMQRTGNRSKARYPEAGIVREFDELCNDDDIELIVVNTPDNSHYEYARTALLAGKNIIVEKPFTLDYSQAMELSELADKKSVMLSVFQNRRWDGDFLTVQKVISEKLLGRLVEFESHFDRYRNFIRTDTWKDDGASGTGTLFNLGSHLIDQAVVLFGVPGRVTADVRIMRSGGTIDDSFEVWLGYNDLKVKVCSSLLVREPGPRYTLHGTNGSFLKWGIDPQEEALLKGQLPGGPEWGFDEEKKWGLLHTSVGGSTLRGTYETLPGCYQEYYRGIYNALRNSAEPPVTGAQAAMVIKIIEAAFQSSKSGNAVII